MLWIGGVVVSFTESKINYDKLCKMIDTKDVKIHFVGVGGVSMYSLARLVLEYGRCALSGSDIHDNERIHKLRELGADIFIGHDEKNLVSLFTTCT